MTDSLEQPPAPLRKVGILGSFKQHLLNPGKTASDVAWSFALGFSIALNPLLGLHTWMVIMLCVIFKRLHRPLILAAAFINNPWTMVPIATASAYLGNILMGRGCHLDLSGIRWHSVGWRSFATRDGFDLMFDMLKPILVPYLVGGAVLSTLALFAGYFAMLNIAQNLRKLHLSTLTKPPYSSDSSHQE